MYQPNNPYGQQQPMYGQQQPMYGQQQNVYGQQQSAYGQQQNVYGQQQNVYGQQQSAYGQQSSGMNVNINLGGMGFGMNVMQPTIPQPKFTQIAVGKGIDQREYQSIIQACTNVVIQNSTPFSTSAGKGIKQALGSEWFVICSNVNDKDYDFSVTSVEGGDYMSFSLDDVLFQVLKINK